MTPYLDTRTVLVQLLVSAVLMILILGLSPRGQTADGLAKWIGGLALVAAAWFLIALRGIVSPIISIAFANSLMLGGLCVQVAALLEFGGRRPGWAIYLPAPLLLVCLLFVHHDFTVYTFVASFADAGALAALASLAWKLGNGLHRLPMVFFYALGALFLVVRSIVIWLSPEEEAGVFHLGTMNTLTFMALFAMTIAGSFGFQEMRRQRVEKQIRHLAMFDALTGVLNRAAFLDFAEREIHRAKRAGAHSGLLMIDIDHFKRVNDTYGHRGGDRVLAAVAQTMKQSLRKEDLLGRYGGEEFCAMLPDTGDGEARLIGERIRAAVEALKLPDDIPATITVSVGVAVCTPSGSGDITSSLHCADTALYRAKHSGRNRVVASDEQPESTARS